MAAGNEQPRERASGGRRKQVELMAMRRKVTRNRLGMVPSAMEVRARFDADEKRWLVDP